ncbi:MAG: hypothetical protein RL497_2757, partial [Pseudomonadota bacterium]
MPRDLYLTLGTAMLLALAIWVFPNQFLWTKFVPKSFLTEYFPLPFAPGWFLVSIILTPVVWMERSIKRAARNAYISVVSSALVIVPVVLYLRDERITVTNLLLQLIWVKCICVPPLMAHILLKKLSRFVPIVWRFIRRKRSAVGLGSPN